MAEETQTSGEGTATHSREELLRMLRHDPHSVSRAEIKAAFQDGRLGDQDLDIPTLAGMKRISELLTDVRSVPVENPPTRTPRRGSGARRDSGMPRPLTEVDTELAALAGRVESLERLVREADVSIESLRRKLDEAAQGERAIRQLWLAVGALGLVALAGLLAAFLVR
jgi:hypothetical protein